VSERIGVLIAEDEPHARDALKEHLRDVDWLEVTAVASDGREALDLFEKHQPQLLFLDVRLPELSGLDVARRLAATPAAERERSAASRPEIVFTTAFDRYAVSAFELGALDYLLKPFGKERLHAALERVRARLAAPAASPPAPERVRAALGPPPLRFLFARTGDRIVPIDVAGIRHVVARGDYAEVRSAAGEHLLHVPMSDLAERLDAGRFVRVHRSHLVNLGEVAELRKLDERRLLVVLKDGTKIAASRGASEALRRLAL
jgi:two-component system LytT family response regulator